MADEQMANPQGNDIPDLGALFADEPEPTEQAAFTGPTATVLVPGHEPVRVPLPQGEAWTVEQVMNAANLMQPVGTRNVYVDGVEAGFNTPVQPGATITPIGAVKAG